MCAGYQNGPNVIISSIPSTSVGVIVAAYTAGSAAGQSQGSVDALLGQAEIILVRLYKHLCINTCSDLAL